MYRGIPRPHIEKWIRDGSAVPYKEVRRQCEKYFYSSAAEAASLRSTKSHTGECLKCGILRTD